MMHYPKWSVGIVTVSMIALVMGGYFFMAQKDKEKSTAIIKSLHGRLAADKDTQPQRDNNELFVGVGSMILPSEGKRNYSYLADWLGEKTGKKITLIFKKSYKEMNDAIENGEIDIAFVCGQPYVEGKKDFGLELLAAPVVGGKMTYNSYIIVPKKSSAKKLSDLKGKTFAFTDPISNTGTLVPTYMLGKMGQTPDKFFGTVIYSGTHDASIHAVANGVVDGASIDGLIWEYMNKRMPGLTAETKIIEVSPDYGIPPVVVRPDLDPSLKKEVAQALLNMNLDPQGREILEDMDIERFYPQKTVHMILSVI